MVFLPVAGVLFLLQTPPVPRPQTPAAPAAPQTLNRDQAQRPPIVGKGSITGVVAGENGQPIKNARVNLSGNAVGRSALTDHNGAFVFDKLPEGRYTLSASRSRYLSTSYGQKRPERQGTSIQLADGEQLKNIAMTLFSAGVITGVVYNDDGEPVQGAQVRAMRYSMSSGVRRLQNSTSALTDDRGQFRLFGMTPGDYMVSATSNQGESMGLSPEVMMAVERAAAGNPNVTVQQVNGSLVTLSNGETLDSPPPVSFAPTFYPGTTQPGSAVTVAVRGGEERAGVDIALQRVQTSNISGVVIPNSGGALPQNINIQVFQADDNAPSVSLPSARVMPDGRFSMRAVPPGRYTLFARATSTVRAEPNAAGAPVQQTQAVHTGRTQISVDGQSLSGVAIALDAGRSLTGRVVFEGGMVDMTKTRLTATMSAVSSGNMSIPPPQPVQVAQDGSFKFTGVAPGRYSVRVNGAQGWSLKSSIVNGRDTLDFPVEIDADDVGGALLTMVSQRQPTELGGLVTDAAGKPANDPTIIVFSSDQQFWMPASRRISTLRPGTDGRYTMRGLPPGDYQIAAVIDIEPGTQYDAEVLKSLLVASTRVSLGEGAKVTQDLRLGTAGG